MENYYEVLGVAQDAPFETIKASYRNLAFLLHPDKNTAHDATQSFQRLGQAWGVLKDDKTRRVYDSQLNARQKKHQPASPTPPRAPQPAKTTHTPDEHPNYDEEQEGLFFEDLMNSPLGGASLFHPPKSRPRKLLRTDSDIAKAQVDLQGMKRKYQTMMKEVANRIKAQYLRLNIQKSEAEIMQAAETDWELVRFLSRITGLEEAISKRFTERVAECMDGMKL